MKLFVGGQCGTIQGERDNLSGYRCFSAAHHQRPAAFENPSEVLALLDSGAFTDSPENRLTPEQALDRQLTWEQRASKGWGMPWISHALVSYDLLIDETWVGGRRYKNRWDLKKADWAVGQTILAAAYLASQRKFLAPRRLVLSCQGVDAQQYLDCTDAILQFAQPEDWIGLGGWCILGRFTTLLPEFWTTLYHVLPRIADRGIKHVHIFGVLYRPALGGLLWLADSYGLSVSTDSTAPILDCTRADPQKAGVRRNYWRDNVAWWQDSLANLRASPYYKPPPWYPVGRQQIFDFSFAG